MASISFHSHDVDFNVQNSRKITSWIKLTIKHEKATLHHLNFIFCSDEYLRMLNIQYLNHKTYTDILTFDTSETKDGQIEGDIFISIQRVNENASKLEVSFEEELRRVIIHGVLHLIGYLDKTPAQKKQMRKKEDSYLSLWK